MMRGTSCRLTWSQRPRPGVAVVRLPVLLLTAAARVQLQWLMPPRLCRQNGCLALHRIRASHLSL